MHLRTTVVYVTSLCEQHDSIKFSLHKKIFTKKQVVQSILLPPQKLSASQDFQAFFDFFQEQLSVLLTVLTKKNL